MSAKIDIQRGVVAEVGSTRDAVVNACGRAVQGLGKHATMTANSTQVTVTILPGASSKMSHHSPVVVVQMAPASDNRITVQTAVGTYRTLQSKFMGFIPIGAKRLVGRGYFFKFLDAFETELRALDPANGRVQQRQASN